MEISLESRLILAAKAARPKAAESPEAEDAGIISAEAAPETDKLTLTKRAVEKLQEQSERLKNLLEPEEPAQVFPDLLGTEEAKSSKSELDALEEGLKSMKRCMEIARRIMRGDKVPPEDERYLMENDPNGFKLAMAMRTTKKKPKKWESVLKDDKKSEQANDGGSQDTAPAGSCEASGGASEGGASDTGGSAE